jgi:septum formation protein
MQITSKKIILGSGSPRRKYLLEQLGLDFRVVTSNTKEIPHPDLSGGAIASGLAEEKADALQHLIQGEELLITADTIVWHNSMMLGKPVDKEDAFRMLSALSASRHTVYTGVCIADKRGKTTFVVSSDVYFRQVPEDQLWYYINHYHPFDKAGSYGAQECLPPGMNPCSEIENIFIKENHLTQLIPGTVNTDKNSVTLIDHIDGSYFNVMGLPIVELVAELRRR